MEISIFDSRNVWHGQMIAAAKARGHKARRVLNLADLGEGYGFIRPHPAFMPEHRLFDLGMRERLTMIQDRAQVEVYEDKTEQYRRWNRWMPETRSFVVLDEALAYAAEADYPLVSKANEGASSVNIRVLKNREEAERHIRACFGSGVEVSRCADGHKTVQRGYVLLQRFIPHHITYRVNIVGRQRAVFERYCYPDRPVAQTGNVAPVKAWKEHHESLVEFADDVFRDIGTKWCALDILWDEDRWALLETSLAWPWPSPGDCDNNLFFPCGKRWAGMWDVLLDEMEAGVWES